MSAFYGMVRGNRGEATRGGSKISGYKASCQSWDGSVITNMWYNDKDELRVEISLSSGSSCYGSCAFVGSMQDLENVFKLARDIEKGDVSIVRHRKK